MLIMIETEPAPEDEGKEKSTEETPAGDVTEAAS